MENISKYQFLDKSPSIQVKFPVNSTGAFIKADRRRDMINWYERPVFTSNSYNRQHWCVKVVCKRERERGISIIGLFIATEALGSSSAMFNHQLALKSCSISDLLLLFAVLFNALIIRTCKNFTVFQDNH